MRQCRFHRPATVVWGIVLLLAGTWRGDAREGTTPFSQKIGVQPVEKIARLTLAATDAATELAADGPARQGTALRYAKPLSVAITPATDGTWENVPGGKLWRLRVSSDGATDLSFGFTTFWMPAGATLHVSSEAEPYYQGPYTAKDNKPHRQLWTPVVPGSSACLELFVPSGTTEPPQLVLSQVNSGYRDLFHTRQQLGRAAVAGCEIDVACPQAAAWSNEVRSVALYSVGGSALCTGTLLANVAGDLRNYFLTANHCGITTANAASVVVYWNYQSAFCGRLGGGSMSQNQSGAILRAARADVDVALLELEEVPDASFKVYYSGWDRSGAAASGAVGIHHPDGDEKAISFSNLPLTNCIASGGGTHWQVMWTAGVTEDGSSGSGLWDSTTHRLVGTLTGGDSSCTTPNAPDCYGKFSVAWSGGASPSSRLKDWLDPDNTGVNGVPGLDPRQRSVLSAAGWTLQSEGCIPTNNAVDPMEVVTVSFWIRNSGGASTSNLVATLQEGAGILAPSGPQEFGVVPAQGMSWRSFTFTAAGGCGATIVPTLSLVDGTNHYGPLAFPMTLGQPIVVFSQSFDAVTAPALPAGWSSTLLGTGSAWATSTAQRDSWPNAVYAANPAVTNDNRLTSPAMNISSPATQLTFRHRYLTEEGFDGGVLEISMDGGAFQDILAAGGSFVDHGYNQTIDNTFKNPLGGRAAWSGNSDGFITTTANLPTNSVGHSIRLRWRFGSDISFDGMGWYVDSIMVFQGYQCCRALVPPVIVGMRNLGSNVAFSYNSVSGQSYIVESRITLPDGPWASLQTNPGTGLLDSYTNSAPGAAQRLFRLRTE